MEKGVEICRKFIQRLRRLKVYSINTIKSEERPAAQGKVQKGYTMANFFFVSDIADHISKYHTDFAKQKATSINVLHIIKEFIGNMEISQIGGIFEAVHTAGFQTYIYIGIVEDGFCVKESRDLKSLENCI